MKTFLISYDLGVPETSDDYRRLINEIKSYPGWAKPLQSVWFIKTVKGVGEVRTHLQKFIDTNDRLLVMDVTASGWSSYNLQQDVVDWLKNVATV